MNAGSGEAQIRMCLNGDRFPSMLRADIVEYQGWWKCSAMFIIACYPHPRSLIVLVIGDGKIESSSFNNAIDLFRQYWLWFELRLKRQFNRHLHKLMMGYWIIYDQIIILKIFQVRNFIWIVCNMVRGKAV